MAPPASAKLLDKATTKAALLAGAAAILIGGFFLTPTDIVTIGGLPEAAVPIIDPDLQQQESARLFGLVQDAARVAVASTVTFDVGDPGERAVVTWADWEPAASPASPSRVTAGVVVSDRGDVLTSAAAARGARFGARLPDGFIVDARVMVFDPEAGLALVQLPPNARLPPAPLAMTVADPLVVFATARTADGLFAAPARLERREDGALELAGATSALPPGAPLFDMRGRAVALLAGGAGALRPYAIDAALDRVRRLLVDGHPMPSSAGVTLQQLTAPLEPFFGARGAIVADVVPHGPAARAGVRPGDLLVAIADEPVAGAADAVARIAALAVGQPVEMTVVRRGQPQTLAVEPDSILDAPWRPTLQPSPPGVPAGDLFEPATLARAAIAPEALVLQVNGRTPGQRRPIARPALVRIFDAAGPRFAVIADARP